MKLESCINYGSADWKYIKIYLNQELEQYKERLCDPNMDPEQTNVIRGSILFIKNMLATEEYSSELNSTN